MRAETVHAARAVTVWSIRGIAGAMLVAGAYMVIKKVTFGVGVLDPHMIFDVWEGTGEGHDTYRGLASLLVGGGLAASSRAVARWVIAAPATGCIRCGYELSAPPPAKCPECGYPVPGGVSNP